jgi:hypothetical protein
MLGVSMNRPIRAGVVGLAVACVVSVPTTASAATKTFDDPAGDSGSATDIRTVTVTYEARLKVVATYPDSTLKGSFLRYWLNTAPKNPGPEYLVTVVPNSDSFGISKIKRFGQIHGQAVDCAGFRAKADIFSEKPRTWIRIPARCLGEPGRIAVAVQTRHGKQSDWVKAPQTFLAFVRQG